MPEVRFFAQPVTWIEVEGEKQETEPGPLKIRNDGGLVKELQKFMSDNNIYPIKGIHNGGGRLGALFQVEDGEKVQEFLKFRGCQSVEN